MHHSNEDEKEGVRDSPRNSRGWDGKLRITNDMDGTEELEAPSPPDSDADGNEEEEQPVSNKPKAQISQVVEVPGYSVPADEDLLSDVEDNETDIDLNHARIKAIPPLQLARFTQLQRLCLRQNELSHLEFPEDWPSAKTMKELDLYDNGISHIKGLEQFTELTSLDLSFNAIKHIKRLDHMKQLTDIFFVQNKISKIEGLDSLTGLTSLELGANRIREIENLDALTNLKELWLGKNKITELKNLSSLHNLTLISIQSNRLTSPSLEHLSTLPNLTDLYISHNAIDSLAPLASSKNLRIIDTSSNPITSLSGLETHTHLEEVWASNCQLQSFEEIEKVLADKEELTTVYFEGNPLQKRQMVLYRNKVRLALPSIKQIDATYVRVE